MTQKNAILAGDIYYETTLPVPQQLELLSPVLAEWIGEDYKRHYSSDLQFFHYRSPDGNISITLGWNGGYGKGPHENDRFRFRLGYTDRTGELTEEQYLFRMTQALELFWSQGIPTCTPGWTDELPMGGGEEGPVKWPNWSR